MSLTKQDLVDIRGVILDALDIAVNPRLDQLEKGQHEQSVVLDEHTRILQDHTNRFRILTGKVDDIDGRLQAIEDDIKELYALVNVPSTIVFDKKFTKLPPDQKLHKLHAAVLTLAKQLHVEL